MQISHELTIHAPLERVWPIVVDPSKAVAAVPGATLESVEGERFTGHVAVKLGAMKLTYAGEGTMRTDDAEHVLVIDGRGREKRGAGTAAATITARFSGDRPDRTAVAVTIDLDLTGKPAQFGRGILAEVVRALAATFVQRLEQQIGDAAATTPATEPDGVVGRGDLAAADGRGAKVGFGGGGDVLDLGAFGFSAVRKYAAAGGVACAAALALAALWRRPARAAVPRVLVIVIGADGLRRDPVLP